MFNTRSSPTLPSRPPALFSITLLVLMLLWLPATTRVAAQGLQQDEHLVFFPGMAHLSADRRTWVASIHGWVFEKNQATGLLKRSRKFFAGKKVDYDKEFNELKKKRMSWFFVDNKSNKVISIRIREREFAMQPSAANGHFRGTIQLPYEFVAKLPRFNKNRIRFEAVVKNRRKTVFSGYLQLIQPRGISVISDIDDTIKLSEVYDKMKLLDNTFKHPYRTIPGMASTYQRWNRHHNISFHYLSASPWQLYVPLSQFMDKAGFPRGTFHMRYFRVHDRSFFNLMKSSQKYKEARIHEIVSRFPKRRFILVGDSGERDYHIYTKIAEQYPGRIRAIFIHEMRQKPIRAFHRKKYSRKRPPCPIHIYTTDSKPANLQMR